MCKKISLAIDVCKSRHLNFNNVVVAGGVAANNFLRMNIEDTIKKKTKKVFFPPPNLCTDNGAMIAWAGYELYKHGILSSLKIRAKPRYSKRI